MIAVIAIYTHPELYPPTLNAIQRLSPLFDKIYIICNNVLNSNWAYPSNVEVIAIGPLMSIQEFEKQSLFKKIQKFWLFIRTLHKLTKRAKLVVCYDPIPLLAYGVSLRFLTNRSCIWWYHNHDVIELQQVRKGSISWLAAKLEPFLFAHINIFSLPAEERKQFFPMEKLSGQYFFLPNFPSTHIYPYSLKPSSPTKELKLIYQGSISKGHGLEEVISILGPNHSSYCITLTLIGRISEDYQTELKKQAQLSNTQDWLFILPPIPYKELLFFTAKHHIGLAIHEPKGKIYSTGGTASNKIYEYAACGLPILYLNTPHYKAHLNSYPWAKPIDLNGRSILHGIHFIYSQYELLSNMAKNDFWVSNNYECKTKDVLHLINSFK